MRTSASCGRAAGAFGTAARWWMTLGVEAGSGLAGCLASVRRRAHDDEGRREDQTRAGRQGQLALRDQSGARPTRRRRALWLRLLLGREVLVRDRRGSHRPPASDEVRFVPDRTLALTLPAFGEQALDETLVGQPRGLVVGRRRSVPPGEWCGLDIVSSGSRT